MLDIKKLLTKILDELAKPPIYFKVESRTVTHATGKNYWTMSNSFPAKTGYTRVPIAYRTSDNAVGVMGTVFNGDNVQVITYNYASSSKSVTLYCLFLYVKDSLTWT